MTKLPRVYVRVVYLGSRVSSGGSFGVLKRLRLARTPLVTILMIEN